LAQRAKSSRIASVQRLARSSTPTCPLILNAAGATAGNIRGRALWWHLRRSRPRYGDWRQLPRANHQRKHRVPLLARGSVPIPLSIFEPVAAGAGGLLRQLLL
jgi:hypothetical protein